MIAINPVSRAPSSDLSVAVIPASAPALPEVWADPVMTLPAVPNLPRRR